jgi:hypothetical protein
MVVITKTIMGVIMRLVEDIDLPLEEFGK